MTSPDVRADRIVIVDHDPRWTELFERQRRVVTDALAEFLTRPVEHIGSTAVPGLPAKPIIDLLAVVEDHDAVRPGLDRLVGAGWVRAPEPGDRDDRKHSLCFPNVEHRTHHLHVVEPWWGWPDLLVFRDHLRSHPEVAAEYAALKRALAGADDRDRHRYRAGKQPFIRDTLIEARQRRHDATASMIELPDVRLRTWSSGAGPIPVLMINGGPGLPSYLDSVAALIDDLALVHRYDQRGTGGSPWSGDHTVDQQVADVIGLLDHWNHDRVVLVGHSYGTDLACRVLLAHPRRVAGLVLLSGPFTEPWRAECRATEKARRTPAQQRRLDDLDRRAVRSEDEETEFLALNWFTDHADRGRAWAWALDSARVQRPVNYPMNTQLNADKKTVPLEQCLGRLRDLLPAGSVIIGGAGDPRPASALWRLGELICCDVEIVDDAGHDPWLEQPAIFAATLRSAVVRLVGHSGTTTG